MTAFLDMLKSESLKAMTLVLFLLRAISLVLLMIIAGLLFLMGSIGLTLIIPSTRKLSVKSGTATLVDSRRRDLLSPIRQFLGSRLLQVMVLCLLLSLSCLVVAALVLYPVIMILLRD